MVANSASIPVIYTVTGADANLIEQPILSEDISVVSSKSFHFRTYDKRNLILFIDVLHVPESVETFSGKPVVLNFQIDFPPPVAFTLTPVASHVTFNPTSFTFGEGTSANIVATPTSPTENVQGIISYVLSGAGSAQIGLSRATTSLQANYGMLPRKKKKSKRKKKRKKKYEPPRKSGLTILKDLWELDLLVLVLAKKLDPTHSLLLPLPTLM